MATSRRRSHQTAAVVSRMAMFLGMALVIVGTYAVVVLGPSLVTDRWGADEPGLFRPIVASVVVAVLFEPVRGRLDRLVNRLVPAGRMSPHELLSSFTANLPSVATSEGTGDLARLLAHSTGADRSTVWVAAGEGLWASGVFPASDTSMVRPISVAELPDGPTATSQLVLHRGTPFGAITIAKPSDDPVTPDDQQLVSELAAACGLLLRNISLTTELEQRAADVRASRRRLIAARDAERHRLERDLHDGAQQQVVALKVKLGIAGTIAEREGAPEIVTRVTSLADDAQEAVDALRLVAQGIYPPLLESDGLGAALQAAGRMAPIRVTVSAGGLGRFAREAEETIYFCVLEIVEQARTAGASEASVAVTASGPDLIVRLDIAGAIAAVDLTTATDRIDAVGGTVMPQQGTDGQTTIIGAVPAAELSREPT